MFQDMRYVPYSVLPLRDIYWTLKSLEKVLIYKHNPILHYTPPGMHTPRRCQFTLMHNQSSLYTLVLQSTTTHPNVAHGIAVTIGCGNVISPRLVALHYEDYVLFTRPSSTVAGNVLRIGNTTEAMI